MNHPTMRVLVTGAAGSGTSTLGEALARHWAAGFLEADDGYWLPTPPPFTHRRPPDERNALFPHALRQHDTCVVAGSVMGWGLEVENAFDLVVFLYAPTEVRLERLERREVARFGKANPAFLQWAAQYDIGPSEGRGLGKHNAWLGSRACPVIRLESAVPVHDLLEQALQQAQTALSWPCRTTVAPVS